MAATIQNSLYECVSSREAEDIASLGRAAAEKAAQLWTQMSIRDMDVKKKVLSRTQKMAYIIAHLRARIEAIEAERRELETLV